MTGDICPEGRQVAPGPSGRDEARDRTRSRKPSPELGEEPFFFGSSPIRGCTAKSTVRAPWDAVASEARAHTASPAPRTSWQPLNGRFFGPLRPQRPDPDKLSSGCNKNIISCADRSDEHTYELKSLITHSYAVFCLKK